MSTTSVTRTVTVGGVATDVTSMTCVVTRTDTGATVANTATHPATGVYTFTVTDPALDLTYSFVITSVYGGETYVRTVTAYGATSAGYPITLAEAKAHCRVDSTNDDTYITGLIAAATAAIEQLTNRKFVNQTVIEQFDEFPDEFAPRYSPLASVTSIAYVDVDGANQTVSSGDYIVDTNGPGRVTLAYNASWPSTRDQTNAVTLTYVSGYGDAEDVPATVKHAIKLLLGHWYENREAVSEKAMSDVPQAVKLLCGLIEMPRVV